MNLQQTNQSRLIQVREQLSQLNSDLATIYIQPASLINGGELSLQGNLQYNKAEAIKRLYNTNKMICQLSIHCLEQEETILKMRLYIEQAKPLFDELNAKFNVLRSTVTKWCKEHQDLGLSFNLGAPSLSIPFNLYGHPQTFESLEQRIVEIESNLDISMNCTKDHWSNSVKSNKIKLKQIQKFIKDVDDLLAD